MTPGIRKVNSSHCKKLFRKLIIQPPYFNNVVYYKTESKNTEINKFDSKKYVEDIKSIQKSNVSNTYHN